MTVIAIPAMRVRSSSLRKRSENERKAVCQLAFRLREVVKMTQLEAIIQIMDKHDAAINDPDGGERPFNEPGEVIEAISNVLDDRIEYVAHCGWLE